MSTNHSQPAESNEEEEEATEELSNQQLGTENDNLSISKSQMKKLLRKQRWLDHRHERRKLEKEKRKIRRRAEAQLRSESQVAGTQYLGTKRKLMAESSNKFKIVIDMDFEDYMNESEIAKAAKQVNRIYALNRASEQPFQLYISSLKGKVLDRFNITNLGYQNWDVNISELDYIDLFKSQDKTVDEVKKSIIYLSGDADYTLPNTDELVKDDSVIFVIGGLVDHNRHKNLCHKRATERNIKTAKLPIKENISLCQRHILSTVAVFEILLHVLGSQKEWSEALKLCIPKRKIAHDGESPT